jgi:hypothetical protein
LRWLRWPVVVGWVVALVLLHGLSGSLYNVTNNGASAYLPASAASTKVASLSVNRRRSGRPWYAAARAVGGLPAVRCASAVYPATAGGTGRCARLPVPVMAGRGSGAVLVVT